MESTSRDITDLEAAERAAFEAVLGHELRENQRVIIKVIDIDVSEENNGSTTTRTAEDFAIFSDLSEQEANGLETAILQRSPSRTVGL